MNEQVQEQPVKKRLSTQALIKFFLEISTDIENLVVCKPDNVTLVTSDQQVYEALCCVNQYKMVNPSKLVKLFESTQIHHEERVIVTPQKITELQKGIGEEYF